MVTLLEGVLWAFFLGLIDGRKEEESTRSVNEVLGDSCQDECEILVMNVNYKMFFMLRFMLVGRRKVVEEEEIETIR